MFWTDTVEDIIYQANLDGTGMRMLLNASLEVVGECFAHNYGDLYIGKCMNSCVIWGCKSKPHTRVLLIPCAKCKSVLKRQ